MLSKADASGGDGSCCIWDSSLRAQSITMRMLRRPRQSLSLSDSTVSGRGGRHTYPSMSPSTLAKNLVSSMASVLMLSLSSSSSLVMMGADVMLLDRTLSPRSQTATPVACRSPTCATPLSE